MRDEEADGEHILEFPAGGRIEGLIHNISLPKANLVDSLPHFGGFSGDADVSPHKGTQRVSDVGGIEVPEFGVGDLVFDCRLAEAGGFWGERRLARDSAEDETFEERVAAEAVSAVEACRGNFAAGVEIFDICFRGDIGFDAADHIVRAGADGDEVFADIDIETVAEFAYDGESFGEVLFVEVADIEIDVGGFGFEHLREDGPADDITGGEFGGGVVILHKCPAFGVAQDGSFAAKGFGNERS